MVPNQFGPPRQMVPKYFVCPGGQALRKYRDQILEDHLSMGTEFVGDHFSKGINFMGTVYPRGQDVGDRKLGDLMGSRPNGSLPI